MQVHASVHRNERTFCSVKPADARECTWQALDAIAALGPIIEVGAGTGYWAALLQHRGATPGPSDFVAFDPQQSLGV